MKNTLFSVTERRMVYRHGGREALRVLYPAISGDGAVAASLEGAVQALCRFAARKLLPQAAQAMEAAVGNGTGHLFVPLCYRIRLCEPKGGRGCRVLLEAALWQGEACLSCRRVWLFWGADGAFLRRMRCGRCRAGAFLREKRLFSPKPCNTPSNMLL
jgi:hypothetical protein